MILCFDENVRRVPRLAHASASAVEFCIAPITTRIDHAASYFFPRVILTWLLIVQNLALFNFRCATCPCRASHAQSARYTSPHFFFPFLCVLAYLVAGWVDNRTLCAWCLKWSLYTTRHIYTTEISLENVYVFETNRMLMVSLKQNADEVVQVELPYTSHVLQRCEHWNNNKH